jgi:tRNA dimethylallyltransferase
MSRKFDNSQILAIIGPTASGKSSLAIALAQKYDGEIISVDSRQVYCGMDIGTGKVTMKEQSLAKHHLIDICNPSEDYNVTDFKRSAKTLIDDIRNRSKLPIICGGTLFWVQSLINNQSFPEVPPNPKLREELSQLPNEALFEKLQALDPNRAKTIDNKNSFRLIRALEIVQALGKVPITKNHHTDNTDYFIIALNPPKDILDANIRKRLDERFDQGMIKEVRSLHEQGMSFEKLEAFGLEYRWIARFLQEKIDEQTMREKLYFDTVHYAKRQRTWLRRWEKQGANIHWIQDASEVKMFL